MSDDALGIVALAGLLGVISVIASSILAYHALHTQRQLDQLRDAIRGIGARLGMSDAELPPPTVFDEYAPDAVIDDGSVEREWRPPRGLRRE